VLVTRVVDDRQAFRGEGMPMASKTLSINRAPVLTLWATVVAGRLGFGRDEALTLGRAVGGVPTGDTGW
jgi:hypothetical protein